MLQSMGSQRVGRDLTTEQQQRMCRILSGLKKEVNSDTDYNMNDL